MSFAWKLRRLRAMTFQEVWLRVRRRIRDKLSAPAGLRLAPIDAFGHYFPKASNPAVDPQVPEGVIHLLDGPPPAWHGPDLDSVLQFSLFGTPVKLDDPPDWHKNYISGQKWPADRTVDYHYAHAGGPKWAWEVNRHACLSALVHGFLQTGNPELAKKALHWMSDWVDRNPTLKGVNWTSALEMAVRLIVWTWCLRIIAAKPEGRGVLVDAPLRKLLGSLGQQAEYIAANYSWGSSANNHLIGECCALAFFARSWPDYRNATQLSEWATSIANDQCLQQFWPDGVAKEQAFHYIPFIWEFYLHLSLAGVPFPDEVVGRINASMGFVDAVASCSGFVPQVGDEDDGTVLRQLPGGWPRFGLISKELARTIGTRSVNRPSSVQASGQAIVFPDGGYSVFRTGPPEVHVLFDHGPLGLGSLAAHGHADALSVCVTVDGNPLLVDPGCYTYHDEPEWREYFRSTRAHNTVCIDGHPQAESGGPFLWGRRFRVEPVPAKPHTYRIPGDSTPFYNATHQRSVMLERRELTIVDRISGQFRTAEMVWHLYPDVDVRLIGEREVELVRYGKQVAGLVFEFSLPALRIVRGDPADPKPGPGWYSPGLGRRVPTTSLIVELPKVSGPMVTRITFPT